MTKEKTVASAIKTYGDILIPFDFISFLMQASKLKWTIHRLMHREPGIWGVACVRCPLQYVHVVAPEPFDDWLVASGNRILLSKAIRTP